MFWRDGPEQDEPSAFIHLPPLLRHTLFLLGVRFWRVGPLEVDGPDGVSTDFLQCLPLHDGVRF